MNEEIKTEIKFLEKEKETEFLEVKKSIAIYQKYVTLGNIIGVVLHEGRKPLSWFTNKIPFIENYLKNLRILEELTEPSYVNLSSNIHRLSEEANRLSNFFSRLDPLASNRRNNPKKISILDEINKIFELFNEEAIRGDIQIKLENDSNLYTKIIEEDLYMALANIVENAMFWVKYSTESAKIIQIKSYGDTDKVYIEISNNGPSIEADELNGGIIFLPGYSAKNRVSDSNGTGLGLAISGEAIQRNNGKLEVLESAKGACFRIILLRS